MACMFLQPRRCRGSLHIAVIGRLDQDTAEHFARSVEKLTRSGELARLLPGARYVYQLPAVGHAF